MASIQRRMTREFTAFLDACSAHAEMASECRISHVVLQKFQGSDLQAHLPRWQSRTPAILTLHLPRHITPVQQRMTPRGLIFQQNSRRCCSYPVHSVGKVGFQGGVEACQIEPPRGSRNSLWWPRCDVLGSRRAICEVEEEVRIHVPISREVAVVYSKA